MITDTVLKARKQYNLLYNPLGIIDDTVREINTYQVKSTDNLKGIYENLAAIYRYKFGDAQLEIIWDGKSHFEKYNEEWITQFTEWSDRLCQNKSFIKGIIQLTVFGHKLSSTFFLENHLKAIVNEYFEMKVLKINGHKKVYLKITENLSKIN